MSQRGTDKQARARHRKARKRQQAARARSGPPMPAPLPRLVAVGMESGPAGLYVYRTCLDMAGPMVDGVNDLGGHWLLAAGPGGMLLFATVDVCDRRKCAIDHAAGARDLLARVLARPDYRYRCCVGFRRLFLGEETTR